MGGEVAPVDAEVRSVQLSVVIPMYNEEGNVDELVGRVTAAVGGMHLSYEVILVDDGSRDDTWADIKACMRRHPEIRGIRFARNFGHQRALLAGLAQARGRAIVTMDGDLQHPPEAIPDLVAQWQKGFAVVQTQRQDQQVASAFKRSTSRAFYKLFSLLTGIPMEAGMSDFRLIDRSVLESLVRFRQVDPFLRGVVQWLGYPSTTIPFDCGVRHAGISKFTPSKMLRFASGAIISFSTRPLKLGVWLGVATGCLALFEIVYVLVQYFRGDTVAGWASITILFSLLFAVMFFLMGVLGAYVARIHEVLQDRPRFVISEWANSGNDSIDPPRSPHV